MLLLKGGLKVNFTVLSFHFLFHSMLLFLWHLKSSDFALSITSRLTFLVLGETICGICGRFCSEYMENHGKHTCIATATMLVPWSLTLPLA